MYAGIARSFFVAYYILRSGIDAYAAHRIESCQNMRTAGTIWEQKTLICVCPWVAADSETLVGYHLSKPLLGDCPNELYIYKARGAYTSSLYG